MFFRAVMFYILSHPVFTTMYNTRLRYHSRNSRSGDDECSKFQIVMQTIQVQTTGSTRMYIRTRFYAYPNDVLRHTLELCLSLRPMFNTTRSTRFEYFYVNITVIMAATMVIT